MTALPPSRPRESLKEKQSTHAASRPWPPPKAAIKLRRNQRSIPRLRPPRSANFPANPRNLPQPHRGLRGDRHPRTPETRKISRQKKPPRARSDRGAYCHSARPGPQRAAVLESAESRNEQTCLNVCKKLSPAPALPHGVTPRN